MSQAEANEPLATTGQMIKPLPGRTAAQVVAEVLVPLMARGLIVRRRRAVGALALVDADRRALACLRAVQAAHGPGPVLLKLPRRNVAVVLSASDARVVLDGSPDPFTPANREKRAALSRFEPHSVLISPAPERPARRAFNERALETNRPVHALGSALTDRIAAETDALLNQAVRDGALHWPEFQRSFNRLVRGLVLGDAAAADESLTDELERLRRDANWGYLLPRRRRLREQFLTHLLGYLSRPDPAALSGHIAAHASAAHGASGGDGTDGLQEAVDQVPQWLFAFDAAAIASFAALALLATHPSQLHDARAESERTLGSEPRELPFLRACVLETLRLWPTTPAILRDSTSETDWGPGRLPAGSALLIFAPLFHRAQELVPGGDVFAPERWLGPEPDAGTVLLPFSRGTAACPGRELVLLVTSQLLARVLRQTQLGLSRPLASRLRPDRPLPGTLDHFRLAFRLEPDPAGVPGTTGTSRTQERTAT